MNCEATQQSVLELGPRAQRQKMAEALQHFDSCPKCRAAAEDYDRLQDALRVKEVPEPAGGWSAFEDRLERQVASKRDTHRWSWLPVGAGLAASFLLGAFVLESVRRSVGGWETVQTTASVSQPAAARPEFNADDLLRQAKAFREISEVFDGHASWLLLSNGQAEMGLSSQSAAPGDLLLVRLTMSHNGAMESQADLAIVPGETATVSVQGVRRTLHYIIGTSRAEPTRLTIWTDVGAPGNGNSVGVIATEFAAMPHEQMSAGRLLTAAGAFELNVAMLRTDVAGGRS